uniref:Glutamate dehydrogenase n=1 Tax=Aspergillus awamori TaxID=105351 RepID=O94129_ASPAW|nr:NADP-dependent glutamate dehydrogenase [Aspergillus awamori]
MSNLPHEPEFEQAYKELASTLENSTLFQKNPEYRKALAVVSVPERVIQFRVVWEDDAGNVQVNRGFRVQFNSALGPYKGGLRFHPSVNLSILQVPWFRADLQECSHWPEHGWWYVEHMIAHATNGQESFKGKRVAISGSGNVAQYAALKVIELGGSVVSLSDTQGSLIINGEGSFTPEEIELIAQTKVERNELASIVGAAPFSDANKFKYIAGARPWVHVGKVDVALPSATQNEVSGEEAQVLINAGCKFIAEGSNMGCTQEAIDTFEAHRTANAGAAAIWYAPGKAANAGGVAVSGLEMAQNSARLSWTSEEVDARLKDIMRDCFKNGLETAQEYATPAEGVLPSLVTGSNIAGFTKVAAAMKDQGDWW